MPAATSPAPTPSSTSALPPPSTFDILPPLHGILSRLLLPPPQPLVGALPAGSPSADSSITNSDYLAPKHLGTAVSEVKNKIQKARVAVKGLPDMEMTTEEQEVQIEELEKESNRLRGVMRDLAEAARKTCEEGEK